MVGHAECCDIVWETAGRTGKLSAEWVARRVGTPA